MKIRIIASGSKGNAYKISDGTTAILVEAGIPYKELSKRLQFTMRSIAGVLITHEHGDHAKAVKDLVKRGTDVYATAGTFEALGLNNHRTKLIEAKKTFTVGTFKILPFDIAHDAAEPVAFLIESTETGKRLLYFTDTKYIRYRFSKINYLLAECNYSMELLENNINREQIERKYGMRVFDNHMSLEALIDFLEQMDRSELEEIHLIHLSNSNSDAEASRNRVEALTGIPTYVAAERE